MSTLRRLVALMTIATMAVLAPLSGALLGTAAAATTYTYTVTESSPAFPPGANNVTPMAGDGAPGYDTGSLASAGTVKSEMYFTPEVLFGYAVTLGMVDNMSYWTKTGSIHTADPRDWYLAIYTKNYAGDLSPAWYGDRIGAEPYFSAGLTETAGTWTRWTTDGATNTLRFFESTLGYFGSYTDPDWATFVSGLALSGDPYAGHDILSFSIQTATGWTPGFTGQVDGFRIELTNGDVAEINIEPDCSTVCYVDQVYGSDANSGATAATAKQTIQSALNAVDPAGSVVVAPGTYSQNLALSKSVTMTGPQSGLDACEPLTGGEAVITGTGTLLTLATGSAGSIIDGFTFLGGTRAIESVSGPLNGLQLTNNRIAGFTGSGVFLNDPGIDVTLDQNLVDGSSKTGGGGLVHFDQDNFDGLWFTDNCVIDGATGTGVFVDGNHNVGPSAGRAPKLTGNLIDGNETGANLGRFAFEYGDISGNTFSNNVADGLQGGIQHSTLMSNVFGFNGRSGLALTGFGGNTDPTRGAQYNTITENCFVANAAEGVFFSSSQYPGTISTNVVNENNITGNTVGATYSGTGTINAENNWWGAVSGPSGTGPGTGDPIVGAGIDFSPFRTSEAAGPACIPPDEMGPVTSNTTASPNPIAINAGGTITANVDDTLTGGSTIASAEYSLNAGPWTAMTAVDGTFDEVGENVTGTFTAPSDPGIVDICVQGTDAPGNVGDPECIMLVVYDPNGGFVTGGGWINSPANAMPVWGVGSAVWQQGFEIGTAGWFDASTTSPVWYGTVTQVASGTGGITSASGGAHAVMEGDTNWDAPFSRFDGYRSVWPGTWKAEIDVYLDPAWASGTGFDYSAAATGTDGLHQRDYIFHVTKDTSTGKLLVAGSNNTNFAPRQDLESINHYEVTTAGWYTLQHVFRDQGGALAVDLNLLDSSGNVLFTETRFNAADTIPAEVGGNRYSWFTFINVAGGVAVDNHELWLGPTGRANFGFVSKYRKGATVPDGSTEFQFQAGNLNFHSSAYEWLVVNKASKNAQFKGTGTINGSGNYGFMLWATDGSPDTFRIKIWDKDNGDFVVYDNGAAQPIGGGSIVVHTK